MSNIVGKKKNQVDLRQLLLQNRGVCATFLQLVQHPAERGTWRKKIGVPVPHMFLSDAKLAKGVRC